MQNIKLKEKITDFVNTRPDTIDIIGYGSAVKTQANENEKLKKQIDIIATCDDSTKWHKDNFKLNRNDYNAIAPIFFSNFFTHLGTDIQYISNIKYDDSLFKIGVIDRKDLIEDLNNWKNFYMAGRFQKPVSIIKGDRELELAIEKNRLNALRIVLLLGKNHDCITEKKLYKALCSLSYLGDIRVQLNLENPKKVNNIVKGEFDELHAIYEPLSKGLCEIDNGKIEYNIDDILYCIDDLPENILKYLFAHGVNTNDYSFNNINTIRYLILKYIYEVNYKASICQPIKSSAINNFSSSKTYLIEKRKKYVLNSK